MDAHVPLGREEMPDTPEEESVRRRSLIPPAIASLVLFMGIGFFTSQLSSGGSTWTSNLAALVSRLVPPHHLASASACRCCLVHVYAGNGCIV